MKKQIIIFFVGVATIISMYGLNQEFIKPKTKKVYVSQQQDIELDGEMVVCCTKAFGFLIELSKAVYSVLEPAVRSVNNYASGEKDCLGKVERTQKYEKKLKIKEKIQKCIEQLEKIVHEISILITALDE